MKLNLKTKIKYTVVPDTVLCTIVAQTPPRLETAYSGLEWLYMSCGNTDIKLPQKPWEYFRNKVYIGKAELKDGDESDKEIGKTIARNKVMRQLNMDYARYFAQIQECTSRLSIKLFNEENNFLGKALMNTEEIQKISK